MDTFTKRLILRPPTLGDVDDYFSIHADTQTNLFNPFGAMQSRSSADADIQSIIEHWQCHDFGKWVIAEQRQPEQPIGFGGLSFRQYGDITRLNLYFRFSPTTWGKGYATELGLYSVDYAFSQLLQSAVFGLVRPDNLASIRVLEKCGMATWGKLSDIPNASNSLIYCIEK